MKLQIKNAYIKLKKSSQVMSFTLRYFSENVTYENIRYIGKSERNYPAQMSEDRDNG